MSNFSEDIYEHFANLCRQREFDKVKELLLKGIDPNIFFNEASFLRYSFLDPDDGNETTETSKLLIDFGLDINKDKRLINYFRPSEAFWSFEFYGRDSTFMIEAPIYELMFFISNGIDLNALNFEGQTPLDISYLYRSFNFGQGSYDYTYGILILEGLGAKLSNDLTKLEPEIETEENNRNKEFFYACIRKDMKNINKLLSEGINLNSFYVLKGVNYGFLRACLSELEESNFELASMLLDKGLDINFDRAIFTYILAKEISIRDYNFNVLTESYSSDKRSLFFREIQTFGTKFLIDKGINVNILDYSNKSPLYLAMELEHVHAIKLLKKFGGSFSYNFKNNNIFSYALKKEALVGENPFIRELIYKTMFLISSGIDLNILDGEGKTPLDHISSFSFMKKTTILEGLGAKCSNDLTKLEPEIETEENNRNKEFFYACIRKDIKTINTLINEGINLNSFYILKGVKYGFLRACLSELEESNFELASMLLDKGLDINFDRVIFTYILAKEISIRDYNFYLVEMTAYYIYDSNIRDKKFTEIPTVGTQFLIDKGININILDYNNKMPTNISNILGHIHAKKLLSLLEAKTSQKLN